jgi:hypothetical protein
VPGFLQRGGSSVFGARSIRTFLIPGLLLPLLLGTPNRAAAGPLGALVPAYFYPVPGGYWDQLDSAAGQIRLDAILNPNSGPGVSPDPNYVQAVNNLRTAGGKVLGYVYTNYGMRSLATVEADINTYVSFYAIDGIFLDQMTNDSDPAHLDYYASLYSYIEGLNSAYQVFGNPGTNTQESYLTRPTADTLVIFENDTGYDTFTPSPWVFGHDRSHFANLVLNVPSAAAMKIDLQLAFQRNAGWVFITDDDLPNPYDTLPSYWDQEVAAIRDFAVPEPATGLLGVVCTLCLAGYRNKLFPSRWRES